MVPRPLNWGELATQRAPLALPSVGQPPVPGSSSSWLPSPTRAFWVSPSRQSMKKSESLPCCADSLWVWLKRSTPLRTLAWL